MNLFFLFFLDNINLEKFEREKNKHSFFVFKKLRMIHFKHDIMNFIMNDLCSFFLALRQKKSPTFMKKGIGKYLSSYD
jgi:hypothetical protein